MRFVYKIVVNDLIYIGSTKNFNKRILKHLEMAKVRDTPFYVALKKYGIQSAEVLFVSFSKHYGFQIESELISAFGSMYPYGYNMRVPFKIKEKKRIKRGFRRAILDQHGTKYKSIKEASDITGCWTPNIHHVLSGKIKQTNGFEFKDVN